MTVESQDTLGEEADMSLDKPIYQDAAYLRDDQYKDSGNLDARAELHRRFSTNRTGWHQWVFDQIKLSPGMQVLECGCGPGWLWRSNLQRLPSRCEVTCTDLSPGMVNQAKQALGKTNNAFVFRVENIKSLSFADDSFDSVVANHMLYHVADRDRAFSEVCRVLRGGGLQIDVTSKHAASRRLMESGR